MRTTIETRIEIEEPTEVYTRMETELITDMEDYTEVETSSSSSSSSSESSSFSSSSSSSSSSSEEPEGHSHEIKITTSGLLTGGYMDALNFPITITGKCSGEKPNRTITDIKAEFDPETAILIQPVGGFLDIVRATNVVATAQGSTVYDADADVTIQRVQYKCYGKAWIHTGPPPFDEYKAEGQDIGGMREYHAILFCAKD